MFGNMTTEGLEESGDRLGVGGVLESGAQDGVIKVAYVGKSQSSDAQSITAIIDMGGFEYRETFWITNKKGENFYIDKNDASKKHGLPGFVMVDNMCQLATGHGLAAQETEEKTVNIYDYDAKKELPKAVQVLTGLIGKEITAGVKKVVVDKTKKDGSGAYVSTGETRDTNEIDKFFHFESKKTVSEFKSGQEEAIFYPKWVDKNTGKTVNKAKGADGKSGAPGGAAPTGGSEKPQTSLFDK